MISNSIILKYDTSKYPFQKILASLVFKAPVLHELHITHKKKTHKAILSLDDNLQLRNTMQKLADDSIFYKIYHRWVADVLAPRYAFKISYSAHPKMRVHLAGTGSVSGFHRDVDVTRKELQINCYLPFTDVYETNTIWCESSYGLQDYQPVNLLYGQAILWDGGYLSHGTVHNETENTRVSCDFRFQPKMPERVTPPWSEVLSGRRSCLAINPAKT